MYDTLDTQPLNAPTEPPTFTPDIEVTGAEAETLMFLHLRLAARYFEVTDFGVKDRVPVEHSGDPMRAWIDAMEALYPVEEG